MANRPTYDEQQVEEFIKTAQEIGISPAIKLLGYPSFPTAQSWFKAKGLEYPNVDSLMAKAAEMKIFYTDREKKYALQVTIDAIVNDIQNNNDLDADAYNKHSNSLAKLIQSFQLVEGKSTQITESHKKDGIDLDAMDLINAAKARNALADSEAGNS